MRARQKKHPRTLTDSVVRESRSVLSLGWPVLLLNCCGRARRADELSLTARDFFRGCTWRASRGRARSRIDCFQNGLLELLKMAAATALDAELVLVGGVAG